MTTYASTITLNDSERIALTEALSRYIQICDEHMPGDKACAPFYAHRHSCREILKKLANCSPRMTSTYFPGYGIIIDGDDK